MSYGSEVEKLERRWMENPMGVSFAPLAEAYRRAGDQPRALEVLAIGLANHPAYVPALIVQARCHLDLRADGAAEESFMAVLATDGHNLIALKGLADICERSDRPEQARSHLDRLLEADPTHDEGRAQMDRLTGVLSERDRLRGHGAGTATLPASELAVAEANELEPVEPMVFEPTDAGSFDDPSVPAGVGATVEPIVETGEDPDVREVAERPEPELLESVGWDAAEAEPVAGSETNAPDFEVEKDSAPFDAEEAGAPAAHPSVGNADLAVPFEEELPAPWREESPDDLMADVFRDELAVERTVEADLASPESVIGHEARATDSAAPPNQRTSFWAPMGAAWAPEAAAESPGQATPSVDEDRAEESPWAEAAEAEPTTEPEPDPRESATPQPAAVPAAEASTETQEALLATEPSPTVEDTEPLETETCRDPASEALPAVEAADDMVTVVDGAESEIPADPDPEIEPALILTETMARLFERQGHRTMALAIYAQLAEQAPGNPELVAAVERLTGELSAGSGTPGAGGRGAVDAAAVDAILGRGGSSPGSRLPPRSDPFDPGLRLDAPATRASEDLFSLSAVFGPARSGPAAQSGVFAPDTEAANQEPSFDEFFGSAASSASEGGQAGRAGAEDLEQFTAWLRTLKR